MKWDIVVQFLQPDGAVKMNDTATDRIEMLTDVTATAEYEWNIIKEFLCELKYIKIRDLETIMVTLKDYDRLLSEKSTLTRLRELLMSLNRII